MLDANQVWEVGQAIEAMGTLASCDPYWIEEPTSPDDILGHAAIARAIAPIRVATGEHVHNRIMFKQFFAAGAISVCQADSCRLAGVNENVLVYLMAAKFGIPVCPHAGGVGLCEMVQHLVAFDYLGISGSLDGRMAEYVDHLHEAFVDPVVIEAAAYRLPTAPGYSTEMLPEVLDRHAYPDGPVWREAARAVELRGGRHEGRRGRAQQRRRGDPGEAEDRRTAGTDGDRRDQADRRACCRAHASGRRWRR